MSKKVIIIGVVFLILGGVVSYIYFEKNTPTSNQSTNNNVVPTQKLNPGIYSEYNIKLDFLAGGSIFGSSFEVKVSGAHITYRETTHGGTKEANKIERSLLPVELDGIRKTISDADLTNLQSQDFTKEPLLPDQATYRITVSLDGKKNIINC